MQDIHSITSGGGGGRSLFGGSSGDRRLRHHNHHHHHHQGNGPQALKCPRCESLNTKFCYYNNYNLSEPRYFCKSCRRYWTKGGVLRNVPVGGGCRKKKRSKPKASCKNPKSSNSHNSSSDSDSSLTATNTTTTAANTTATAPLTAAEASSGVNSTKSVPTVLHRNPSLNPPLPDHSSAGNDIFPEIDALTSLIASSSAYLPVEFNVSAGVSPFRLHHAGRIADHTVGDDLQVQETSTLGFMDAHTPSAGFSGLPEKTTEGGFCTVDWSSCTDQALFDLTGTVDQSYWNQTQWD